MVRSISRAALAASVIVPLAGSALTGQTSASSKPSGTRTSGSAANGGTPARVRYVVAPTGNEARYRVREQLVSFDLPNDAVGATKDIVGVIVVDANGALVRDSSRIVVSLARLKSDQKRRDAFVQNRAMQTDKYPTVEIAPTALRGIVARPTGAEPVTFDLLGDLTVHGTTRPTEWRVTAHAEGADVVGTATTAFTFKDFELDQPHVPVVLSVADTIKLEYDFRFTPSSKAP